MIDNESLTQSSKPVSVNSQPPSSPWADPRDSDSYIVFVTITTLHTHVTV